MRRRLSRFALPVVIFVLTAGTLVPAAQVRAEEPTYTFIDWRTDLAPLTNAKTWVLVGQPIPGGCSYSYPAGPEVIPDGGWELRSIALDPSECAKLMEEGTPTTLVQLTADKGTTSLNSGAEEALALAPTSSQSAWEQVVWRDIVGLWLNYDVSQVDWSYNGSIVTSGSTHGHWGYRWGSGWSIDSYGNYSTWGSGSSYLRSESWSNFSNSIFCWPLPTVYTHYYYNRVWGFPDGHATRSQSSASFNECLPFHFDVYTAYGNWPGTVP
jgi:hypothetical protein